MVERADRLPADEQAKVLIPHQVVRGDIFGIAVKDKTQAKEEVVRFQMLTQQVPRVMIVEDFFNADRLRAILRSESFPTGEEHCPGR